MWFLVIRSNTVNLESQSRRIKWKQYQKLLKLPLWCKILDFFVNFFSTSVEPFLSDGSTLTSPAVPTEHAQ